MALNSYSSFSSFLPYSSPYGASLPGFTSYNAPSPSSSAVLMNTPWDASASLSQPLYPATSGYQDYSLVYQQLASPPLINTTGSVQGVAVQPAGSVVASQPTQSPVPVASQPIPSNPANSTVDPTNFVPVNQPAPQPIAQPAPQPIAEPAPQPVAQPAPQPIAEPAPQPVAQPAPQPVAEPAPQTIAQPAPQPIAEPASEPVAQDNPGPANATVAIVQSPVSPTAEGESDVLVDNSDPEQEKPAKFEWHPLGGPPGQTKKLKKAKGWWKKNKAQWKKPDQDQDKSEKQSFLSKIPQLVLKSVEVFRKQFGSREDD